MTIKNSIWLTLLLGTSHSSMAISPVESAVLDIYIFEQKKTLAESARNNEQPQDEIVQKLDEIETQLLPLTGQADRIIADLIRQEADFDRTLSEIKKHGGFNPYTDSVWKTAAKKDLILLCCEIKADPARQERIRRRVAEGIPHREGLARPNKKRTGGAPEVGDSGDED